MTVSINKTRDLRRRDELSTTVSELFAAFWAELERSKPRPQWIRRVIDISYDELTAKVTGADEATARQLTESLYAGDVFIVKGAIPGDFCRSAVNSVFEFGRQQPASFHKMLDGCPDFHRVIDNDVTKSYSVTAIRHGYYFFRWNGDPLGLFGPITEQWRVFKTLSGLKPNAYEVNLPRDGVVDRLIFYRYPKGGGQLKTHVDPTNNHKLIMSTPLSTRGIDFQSGGIYFVDSDDQLVDVESHLESGDSTIAYPTVQHGVSPVDPTEPIDWKTINGRWLIGMASVDSDHVAERVTAQRVE